MTGYTANERNPSGRGKPWPSPWLQRPGPRARSGSGRVAREQAGQGGLEVLAFEETLELGRLLELDSRAAGRQGSPDSHLGFARAIQDRFEVHAVCVTRGERGCLLVDGEAVVDAPGVEVRVVDTVGAGDAFTAALIAARLRGWSPPSQAAFANAMGALVASRPGAMPMLRDEIGRWMSGQGK